MTEQDEGQEQRTTLGTEGVPYGSEAMEEMVAVRMQRLSASGRPAERMGVIKALASEGRVQTMAPRPTNLAEDKYEQGLNQSLTPDQRAAQEAAQARQGHQASSDGAGRTLAEAQALRAAQANAQVQRSTDAAGTVRRLSEQTPEAAYEGTYNRIVGQGHSPQQARSVAELEANRLRRLAKLGLPSGR